MTPEYVAAVHATAEFLKSRIPHLPEAGFLTGTGLSGAVDRMESAVRIAYGDIPDFPVSTVESHAGQLVFGRISGRSVVAMQGRFHMYEGYSPLEVTFPIRVMQVLGVKTLVVTNAAGGLNTGFTPGDIMVIRDHINLSFENPLIGPNHDPWGLRFPDMAKVYDPELAELALCAGEDMGFSLRQGVYAGLKGPSLETPAETRMLKILGADAVGFSTIPEVIAGVHAGMRILGLSTITNVNDPDNQAEATVEEIIAVANRAAPRLEKIIAAVLGGMTS